jgi:hypothetical protein
VRAATIGSDTSSKLVAASRVGSGLGWADGELPKSSASNSEFWKSSVAEAEYSVGSRLARATAATVPMTTHKRMNRQRLRTARRSGSTSLAVTPLKSFVLG